MPAVRIGIAGWGSAARIHFERPLSWNDVEIVGFTDRELATALDFADRAELRQAATDGVAIFTPDHFHYRIVMDALPAGRHVFIDKPLSTDAREAPDLMALAGDRSRRQ